LCLSTKHLPKQWFCDSAKTVSEEIQQATGRSKICNQPSDTEVWISWYWLAIRHRSARMQGRAPVSLRHAPSQSVSEHQHTPPCDRIWRPIRSKSKWYRCSVQPTCVHMKITCTQTLHGSGAFIHVPHASIPYKIRNIPWIETVTYFSEYPVEPSAGGALAALQVILQSLNWGMI
jgi:hypothetical protein